jgi:hypothetical protein
LTAITGPARQQVVEELVPMPEAALLAYIAAFGIDHTISRVHRNDMAEALCQLLTVYYLPKDGQTLWRLEKSDLEGGVFAEGGQLLRFRDRREALAGLAVTRTELKAALAALKDTRKPTS